MVFQPSLLIFFFVRFICFFLFVSWCLLIICFCLSLLEIHAVGPRLLPAQCRSVKLVFS